MPIIGLPDFTNGILTSAQLNAISSVLQEKFAGQIGAGDLAWPLICGGDINLGRHNLLNVGRIWNQYNLADRASGATVQSVIDALAADGGGVIIVPGNTVVTADSGGLDLADNVWFVGHGPSSVLAIHASASDSMIRLSSSSDNCAFINMTIRGATGVDRALIEGTSDTGLKLIDVTLEDHGNQPFLLMSTSSNVTLDHCTLEGLGTTDANTMISLTDANNFKMTECTITNWSNILLSSSSSTNLIIAGNRMTWTGVANLVDSKSFVFSSDQNILFADNYMGSGEESGGSRGIKMTSCTSAVITDNELRTATTALLADESAELVICGNNIDSKGDGIILGCDSDTSVAVGSRTPSTVSNGYTVNDNIVNAEGAGIAICHNGTSGLYGTMCGNKVQSTTYVSGSIWNLGTATTLSAYMTVTGNLFANGFYTYEGAGPGSTRGARIGLNNNAFWVFVGNISPGTLIGASANYDMEDSASDESAVTGNVV